MKLVLLGIGAANSPRYRPAGLLIVCAGGTVMLDGGGTAVPCEPVDAWLVSDLRRELIADIRQQGCEWGVRPEIADLCRDDLRIEPKPVVHTSHPAFGYLIRSEGPVAAWAPEFWEFPDWAAGADLMFADAAGWRRPIRFTGGVGGHAAALDTAGRAASNRVGRLVFAHVGRPSIRAMDAGDPLPCGEWGIEGHAYRLGASSTESDDGGPQRC